MARKQNQETTRDIPINNILSQQFSVCIQKRDEGTLKNEKVLSPSQAGFQKDHIFTLFSLIKKPVRKGKYPYTCFADFFNPF